jgi:hypothetical protein
MIQRVELRDRAREWGLTEQIKVSEDSKHEKNVRHGHISTLHIWPARRPLAACRAAIIAALMPDPGTEQERHALNKKKHRGHYPLGYRKRPGAGLLP